MTEKEKPKTYPQKARSTRLRARRKAEGSEAKGLPQRAQRRVEGGSAGVGMADLKFGHYTRKRNLRGRGGWEMK
jgi:hypothetical protein